MTIEIGTKLKEKYSGIIFTVTENNGVEDGMQFVLKEDNGNITCRFTKEEFVLRDFEPLTYPSEYKKYIRVNVAEMKPYEEGFDMTGVSISEVDKLNGSPKPGDMIARNPYNHNDLWLVSKTYFEQNFEEKKNER